MTQTDYTSSYLPNFAYTQADVEANRQGILTQDQFFIVESVYQARQSGVRQTYRLFALWIPLLIVIGFIIEYRQANQSLAEFLPYALQIAVIIGAGVGALMLISWVFTVRNARDARDKRISVAEGKAKVIEDEVHYRSRHYMRYELKLGNRLFRFANHSSIAHFEDGQSYRVYYIKYYPFPLMLSAEEL
ncbi:MAG: hypothetical protein GC179_14355 [Anaerolineaceae bacterium]|nr:hypothetical protein [Anaerolineaceae bacterium]